MLAAGGVVIGLGSRSAIGKRLSGVVAAGEDGRHVESEVRGVDWVSGVGERWQLVAVVAVVRGRGRGLVRVHSILGGCLERSKHGTLGSRVVVALRWGWRLG